jgi:hypothetical protein
MNRKQWKHAAMQSNGWPGVLFVGTQAGVAQALKDCEVPMGHGWTTGLNKAQYSLSSTGTVPPKLLKTVLRGVQRVF